jgi:hypothetical protein
MKPRWASNIRGREIDVLLTRLMQGESKVCDAAKLCMSARLLSAKQSSGVFKEEG